MEEFLKKYGNFYIGKHPVHKDSGYSLWGFENSKFGLAYYFTNEFETYNKCLDHLKNLPHNFIDRIKLEKGNE